jgi:uncharacterized protein
MKCPKDGKELTQKIYEADVEIDHCEYCNGIWLDKGELEKIQETFENDYSEFLNKEKNYASSAMEMASQKQEKDLECPSCGELLFKKEYGFSSQIIIDICTGCRGIWLDDGELQQLEIFFERTFKKSAETKRGVWGKIINFLNKEK